MAAPASPVADVQATIVLSPPSHAAASDSGIAPEPVSRRVAPKRFPREDWLTHTPRSVATAAVSCPSPSVTSRPTVVPVRPETRVWGRCRAPRDVSVTAWALLQQS